MKITNIIKNSILILLISFGLLFAGCTSTIENPNNNNNNTNDDVNLQGNNEDLKKFNSAEELEEFLLRNSKEEQFGRNFIMTEMALDSSLEKSSGASSNDGATTYSKTNNQVQGVDEPDIVKNDGKYIYTISNGKIIIVEAFPTENAKVLSEIKLEEEERISNIFVNENTLIVFINSYENELKVSEYDFVPRESYVSKTIVKIYDIEDRKNPEILKDYSVNGYYNDARMIGDYVYFISVENIWGNDVIRPMILERGIKIVSPDIYYFDIPHSSYNFHTISSINLNNLDEIQAKTLMLGYSNELYVSENNIYITSNKYYERNTIEEFFEVIYPLLPSQYKDKLNNVEDEEKIVEILEEMYNLMSEDDTKKLIEKIREAQDEYYAKQAQKRDRTVIHKININNGKIEYDTKGEVAGHMLNQFSLDEFEENLRVATTTSYWTTKNGREQYNNVYVLNSKLEEIGKIEKIAPDERIYSTRFMEDKLYMVTFKQVDPLFVIDLKNSEKPEILGYLKIPGFSDYLQMYDENILIGIGKETYEENERTRTKGVKISMFNVSDFENPEEIESIIIGNSGSYSLVSNDHKALLLDREKKLMVVPLREVGDYGNDKNGYYREDVWNGVYVFSLSSEGFNEKGKISHDNWDSKNYWYSPSQIKRSLFMENVLYTISESKIGMNNLETMDEINQVDLGYEEEKQNFEPYSEIDYISVKE